MWFVVCLQHGAHVWTCGSQFVGNMEFTCKMCGSELGWRHGARQTGGSEIDGDMGLEHLKWWLIGVHRMRVAMPMLITSSLVRCSSKWWVA